MGNSYSEDNLLSLYCSSPPGPADAANPSGFGPNVFTGMNTTYRDCGPLITLGAADFSYEFWMRWGLGEVKIYVRREDLARARVVLKEYLEQGET